MSLSPCKYCAEKLPPPGGGAAGSCQNHADQVKCLDRLNTNTTATTDPTATTDTALLLPAEHRKMDTPGALPFYIDFYKNLVYY